MYSSVFGARIQLSIDVYHTHYVSLLCIVKAWLFCYMVWIFDCFGAQSNADQVTHTARTGTDKMGKGWVGAGVEGWAETGWDGWQRRAGHNQKHMLMVRVTETLMVWMACRREKTWACSVGLTGDRRPPRCNGLDVPQWQRYWYLP